MEVAVSFLADIALMMIMALILGYAANKLGQPAMLGYLFAGMIIGPYSPSRLISNLEEIEALANVGVSLLLFMVGLEFSPKKLKDIWRPSAISGAFEMLMMFLLGTVAGLLLGWTLIESVFLGTMLMISSTIIIIKVLSETGQMDTLHGRLLVGRLIVEDMGAIVVITALSSFVSGEASLLSRILPVVLGVIFLIIIIMAGRRIFPRIIESVSRAHSKELFLLAIFGICIGVSVISQAFGLSLALGAFMAGIILAESDHHLDIESQIKPLKDIFLIIFFVSVGMTIDLGYFLTDPVPVLIIIAILMGGKALANGMLTRLMGYHPKTATLVGLSMMQIGEFSFIIAGIGVSSGILVMANGAYSEAYSVIAAAALVTMVFTPYAVRSAPRVYERLLARGMIHVRPDEMAMDNLDPDRIQHRRGDSPHIVILGYSAVVRETMSCLGLVNHHYTVVEYDPKKVGQLREMGIDCVYGDASNAEVLHWAGVDYAHLIVVAISDTLDAENAISHCHERNPEAYIIARAYRSRDRNIMSQYANDVIMSEEVAGKRMAWHVLRNLGLDEEAIKQDVQVVEHNMLSLEDEEVSGE